MRPEPEMILVLIAAAEALKSSQKRLFMAKAVQAMGRGGQRWAEVHLGWCRDTIRKGTHELRTGMTCVDAFSARRRKPAEAHLPRLLEDVPDILQQPWQMRLGGLAAAGREGVDAGHAGAEFVRPLADGVPAPAEMHFGPALPAPSHGLDGLGHEEPLLAALEGLGGSDQDEDHLGFGTHLRKLLGLLVKRLQDTG